ncbi:hypothetical protein FDECE_4902 [Fusarium decemcellulare]|nr:hypothetical protein FDECE_4902 [Fusarium decemcellulare]
MGLICPSNDTALWIREEFLEAGNLKNSFCCDDDWFGVDLNDGGGSACSRRGASLATNEATAEQYTRTASVCTEATSATTKHDTTTSDPTEAASTGSSSEDSTNGDEASISGGAIAGIVIGSIAGVGLLGAATFWIFRRRSVLRQGEQKSEYATAQQWNYVASEMDARPVYELPGKEPRRELDADNSRMT